MMKLEVGNRSKIHEPLFHYNKRMRAWTIIRNNDSEDFIIAIYDEDVNLEQKFRYHLYSNAKHRGYNVDEYGGTLKQEFLYLISSLLEEGILKEKHND